MWRITPGNILALNGEDCRSIFVLFSRGGGGGGGGTTLFFSGKTFSESEGFLFSVLKLMIETGQVGIGHLYFVRTLPD